MASNVDQGKRRFLIASTSAVGAVGAGAVLIPFISSWSPSEKAKSAGAPVEVDVSKVQPGQQIIVEWRGKPVWIVRRTEKMLADMESLNGSLADPASEGGGIQPEYAANATRSIKPELSILVGICTHLGCSPTFRPEVAPADLGSEWKGGYFCPCHGSRFDLAGRVYSGVPAPTNLEVPPHFYKTDNIVLVGADKGAA